VKKFILFACCILNIIVYAQPGFLDNTFGIGGKVTTDFANGTDEGYSVAIQSDGKIVIAGRSYNGSNNDFALVRYNSDGSLDNSFGFSGKVTTAVGSGHDNGYSVAIQSDGRIIVVGNLCNDCAFDIAYDFALVRYNINGSLDNSFGSGGKVITDFGSDVESGTSIAIQADGKVVVAGGTYVGFNYDFAVARYNSDGSLDNTFDSDGKVTTDFGSGGNYAGAVAIQSDGKIVVAGFSNNGSDNNFALARYNSNGSLDSTFGFSGKVTTDFGSSNDYGRSVTLQGDGKIVVAGSSYNGSSNDFALARYNNDGSLDSTFGSSGKIITAIGSSSDVGRTVAIQSDDKIVVAGASNNGLYNDDFALVRYNGDGTLDSSFGYSGKATTGIGNFNDEGLAVAIQGDGKIVVAGSSYINNIGNPAFAAVRYDGGTVGIEENMQMSDVNIYPNPSSGKFTLQSAETFSSIEITNLLGEKVYSTQFSQSTQLTINLSDKPKGIYFVKFNSDKGTEVRKIIIQK